MNIAVKNSTLILSLSILVIGCTQSSDEYITEDIEESILVDAADSVEPLEVIETWTEETPMITSCFQRTNGGFWGTTNMCTEFVYYGNTPDIDEERLGCEIQGQMDSHSMTFSESRCPTEGEVDRCSRNYYEDENIVTTSTIVVYPPVDEHYLKASEGLCTLDGPEYVYSKPSSK